MTEAEAHHFVSRWSRRMMAWRARNEMGQLHDLERSFTGIMGGMVLTISLAAGAYFSSPICWTLAAFAIPVLGFSLWMILQLRQARRALKK